MTIDHVGRASTATLTPPSAHPAGTGNMERQPSGQPSTAVGDALLRRTSLAPASMPPRTGTPPPVDAAKAPITDPSSSLRHEITVSETDPSSGLEQAAKVTAQNLAKALGADDRPLRERHIDTLQQYGATRDALTAFESSFGAHFIPSASAGNKLASLNDHVGILKIPAYDGPPDAQGVRTTVAEQFAVIKAEVPSKNPQEPAGERYFVKGYGDRFIDFNELAKAMAFHSPHAGRPLPEAAAARHQELGKVQYAMETPLRSEIKRLSMDSELSARRDGKESDAPVMPLPANPTPMAWRESWANSEAAMSPGGGPMLANGTRKFQLDYNATENRLIIFRNDNDKAPRKESILSDSLPENLPKKLAPAWCEGPTLAEIHGIKGWEDMGPGTDHKGVKQGNTQRLLHATKEKLFGKEQPAPSDRDLEAGLPPGQGLLEAVVKATPGAHIRITTEDGAVHDLKVDEKGIKLSLANPQPAKADRESLAAFGGPSKAQADVDLYSYSGRDTGLYGSKTGFADPKLVTSTGDLLKAGPLLKSNGSTAVQGALRVLTFQPLINGQDRSEVLVRLANTALTTASKFLYVWATSAINEQMKGGQNGSYVNGVKPFNASGAGSIGQGELAGAAALIVLAQETVTVISDLVSRVLPEPWKRKPESHVGKLLKQTALPMAEEMVRLMVNMGAQKAVGINRGSRGDFITVAAASIGKGAIDTMREHAGPDRANHPVANAMLDLAQGVQYNLARASGNAASSEQGLSNASFREALINRLVTRGFDQIVVPPLKELLNTQGIVGPNASAFDSQLSHEYRIENLGGKVASAMKAMVTELDPQGFKDLHGESGGVMASLHAGTEAALVGKLRKEGGTEFYSGYVLGEERIKQQLNRVDLAIESPSTFMPTAIQNMAQQLGLMEKAIENELQTDPSIRDNVRSAGEFPTLSPRRQLAHLEDNEKNFKARVDVAKQHLSTEEGVTRPETSRPLIAAMTNSLEETAKPQQKFTAKLTQALAEHVGNPRKESDDHSGLKAGKSMLERPVPSATNVDYGLVQRPFGGGASDRIPRAQTTFSTLPQAKTYEKNRRMAREPGIDSIQSKPNLTSEVRDRIEMAVRDYTVESQFFHYPLRWQVTGELQHEPIAPGIDVPYNVMNKRGNTAGSKKDTVDPIEALYINLGAQVSDKFPTEMFRAVVTEAAYKARLGEGEAAGDAGLLTVGSKGVLTEILSATMATQMAAGFNLPIANYGSAPRENSLRIDMNQESGVNIATWADLAQGEVIMMPGAVMQVQLVDPTAGKGAAAGTQDIGQVVYMKAVDTYALELAHDAFKDYKDNGQLDKKPADGAVMIDPKSGHFFKFDAAKDDIAAIPETKNYFTGRPLESVNDKGEAGTEQARWRLPYTSDGATRSTKDGIHMAILRNDPIVPYLNLATENVHHAWFSKKAEMAGTFNEVRAAKEAAEKAETRGKGQEIAGQIKEMKLDTPLREEGVASTEMLAWVATSMLRKPIQLVPVDDSGATPKLGDAKDGKVINQTYDKVDLQHARQSITGRNPPPAVLIGVGEKGYYAIAQDQGEFKATARIGEDKSLGNLLHAVVRGGYAKPSQYVEQSGVLTPDTQAQKSVDGLLKKMQQFTGTDYLVLQQAMVSKRDELAAAADPKGKAKMTE
jgi:hypothetical protein